MLYSHAICKCYACWLQNGKRAFDTTSDAAAQKLFRFVSPKVWDRPTFRLLAALRDNYNATTGQVETETAQVSSTTLLT
jgi:hypothetical protein